jgi:hypothetical protein
VTVEREWLFTETDLDLVGDRTVGLDRYAVCVEAGALWERRYGWRMTHSCKRPYSLLARWRCGKCRASTAAMREFVRRWFHG